MKNCNDIANTRNGFHACRCDNFCENNPCRDRPRCHGYCNAGGVHEKAHHVVGKITKEEYAILCVVGCYSYIRGDEESWILPSLMKDIKGEPWQN